MIIFYLDEILVSVEIEIGIKGSKMLCIKFRIRRWELENLGFNYSFDNDFIYLDKLF